MAREIIITGTDLRFRDANNNIYTYTGSTTGNTGLTPRTLRVTNNNLYYVDENGDERQAPVVTEVTGTAKQIRSVAVASDRIKFIGETGDQMIAHDDVAHSDDSHSNKAFDNFTDGHSNKGFADFGDFDDFNDPHSDDSHGDKAFDNFDDSNFGVHSDDSHGDKTHQNKSHSDHSDFSHSDDTHSDKAFNDFADSHSDKAFGNQSHQDQPNLV